MGSTGASLVAQMVKTPSAMQKSRVRSLGWEDALEEGMETHSRIPREFHGQRSLGIDSPTLCSTLASKELDVTESTNRGLEVLELIPCFWFYI